MSTRELMERLERHYIKPSDPLPGGVFLPEVGLNGLVGSRADALYVGFTSTSGRLLVGHEVKVSRADWLRELDQPDKATTWADQCHAWYVVAPSTDIVAPGELPDGWGLMVPTTRTRTRLHVEVRALVHRDRHPSWLAARSILARADTLRAAAIRQEEARAREKARKEAEERIESEVKRRTEHTDKERADRLQVRIRAIEEALGSSICPGPDTGYCPCDGRGLHLSDLAGVAEAARAHGGLRKALQLVAGRYATPLAPLRKLVNQLDAAIDALKAAALADQTGGQQ